jgi:Uncharacterised MFS-type transporter YbfB
LVGGTFMVATMVGLQHARASAPNNPTPLLGQMSAGFASGQIAGPLVALVLSRLHVPGWSGIEMTLGLAAASLLVGAVWLRKTAIRIETAENSRPVGQSG